MSDDQSSRNQIFYFVDSNSSSREKRAHVMRHHVQEKRRQRKSSHSRADGDRRGSRPLRYSPWPHKRTDVDNHDDYESIAPQEVPSETSVNGHSLVRPSFTIFTTLSPLITQLSPPLRHTDRTNAIDSIWSSSCAIPTRIGRWIPVTFTSHHA